MKVLLIKDVYKLGRAGDVKKVADGYGRNFLIPQGMAVLATKGALKQADRIRTTATERRAIINEEMGAVAEVLAKVQLSFGARAGETGKLYGSITSQDVVDQILEKSGVTIKRQQIDMQPLRSLGEHSIHIRLTMDLIPELKVIVFREGEAEPSLPIEPEEPKSVEVEQETTEGTPAEVEAPVLEEPPVEEELLVVEEPPAEEELQVVEEPPAAEEEPQAGGDTPDEPAPEA
jgi:large subunit ribosomal protein L9